MKQFGGILFRDSLVESQDLVAMLFGAVHGDLESLLPIRDCFLKCFFRIGNSFFEELLRVRHSAGSCFVCWHSFGVL
jgi:hypothetical protein